MTKFEEWFENYYTNEKSGTVPNLGKDDLEEAWNAALNEIREAVRIHDTMGDIINELYNLETE